jgi:hypothetical protein
MTKDPEIVPRDTADFREIRLEWPRRVCGRDKIDHRFLLQVSRIVHQTQQEPLRDGQS